MRAVSAKPMPATAAAAACRFADMRAPAIAGPRNAPRPSPVLHAVFAATSSPGLRAMAGIRVIWVGRTGAAAAAVMAARTNSWIIVTSWSAMVEPAVSRASAVRTALAARTSPTTTRIRSPRKRSISAPETIPTAIAGMSRTAPIRPAARTPPRLNTVTSVTTVSAASAAIPIVHEMPSRRMPSLANASRTAATAERAPRRTSRPAGREWRAGGSVGGIGAASAGRVCLRTWVRSATPRVADRSVRRHGTRLIVAARRGCARSRRRVIKPIKGWAPA